MTRVLLLSLNYAPEETGIGLYSAGVAEHLSRVGYRVTAVTGMPHYPAWRIDPAYRGRWHVREWRDGVEVRRVRSYVPGRQSAPRRGLYEASSLSMALEAFRAGQPDAVIGVVPSLSGGIAARMAAMRFGVPYGLIVQDLVGAAAEQTGAGRAISTVARAAEGWAARAAEAVGIVAEGFRSYMEAAGVEPPKIRRVRNWSRAADATVARDEMRARLGWAADDVICLHGGNMGAKQGLENVIDAARLAAHGPARLRFVLMGDGSRRAALEGRARGLSNVAFLPLQPSALVPSVLRAADILLLNQLGSVRDMSLPSKLTAYFAAARPVVAACAEASETAREVRDSGAGVLVSAERPRELLDAIARVAGDAGLAAHLASRGEAWARDVLSETAALRGYEQLLAAVLAAGTRGRVLSLPEAASQEGKGIDRWAA